MRKPATPIVLSEAEQETLRSWLRAGTSEQRMVERARIVLAAADGVGTNVIARQLQTRPARGSKWRTRFARDRLTGLAPRPHRISLRRRRTWCLSTGPAFAQKAADIVGLYLDPPENALVLCVDEKPGIQALERSQGWLRLPDGRSLTGFAHEYKRHGTTTLFAALEVASGLIQ